jgi:predicted ATP-grasp superfamily ATP-dependent carboligase
MLENETIKLMMDNGHLTESDALIAFASQYKELTDYVNAYNAALLSRDENMIKEAEANLRSVTAMQSLINEYNKLNGVKITFAEMQYMVEKIRADMLALNEDYTPEEGELEELAA